MADKVKPNDTMNDEICVDPWYRAQITHEVGKI